MFWLFLIIAIIVVIVIFKKNSGRSSNTYTPPQTSGYADTPRPSFTRGTLYAAVYPYGFWSVCTYTCDATYDEGDLVVVDIKGKQYPGRIVNLSSTWPEEVPRNVTLKPVLRRLKATDKGRLEYWSDKIDEFFTQ